MNPDTTPQPETEATTQSTFTTVTAPLHQPTSISKILAAVLFIILPFVGVCIGYSWSQEQHIENTFTEVVPNWYIASSTPIVISSSTSELPTSILNNPVDVIYAVKESEIAGDGRGYPVMGLYRKSNDDAPIKFATVGALKEFPIEFAVSPDKKKVAVNLESKLVLIDVETGTKETLFTPKFVIGGRITFSPDSTQVAFVDGNYYVDTDYVTLYTVDVTTKKITSHIERPDLDFIDVDVWRSDNILVLSTTVPKGCAKPQYVLYDLRTQSLSPGHPDLFAAIQKGMYIAKNTASSRPPACEKLSEENMCSEIVYFFSSIIQVTDPIKNTVLGDFGAPLTEVSFVALSPDATSVLYSSRPVSSTELQCDDRTLGVAYFIKNFKTGNIEQVSDLGKKLAEWDITLADYKLDGRILTNSYRINQ